VIFVEVTLTDPSEFASRLDVRGEVQHSRYRVLTFSSSTVPNALAALLLAVRDQTDRLPHIYFEWSEGNPAANLVRFLFFGVGEVAPVTREIIRRAEPDRSAARTFTSGDVPRPSPALSQVSGDCRRARFGQPSRTSVIPAPSSQTSFARPMPSCEGLMLPSCRMPGVFRYS
jgi:hypothetical protein